MTFQQKKSHLMTVNAHRGYNIEHPENTLIAYSAAIELGAEYIELDVRKCKDGTLVISHDVDLKRSAKIEKIISEMTLEELKQVDLGQEQTIPTFEEVLELCQGKIGIHVEIKEIGLCKEIAALVQKYQMENDVIFSSFKHAELLKMKQFLPDTPSAICVPEIKYEGASDCEIIEDIMYKAEIFHAQGIHINIMMLEDGDIVDRAHEKGLWLNTFNVDSFMLWDVCLEWGVDGIFTNNAKGFIEYLNNKQNS